MKTLSKITKNIRSKNAGTFWVTVDLFFKDKNSFFYACENISNDCFDASGAHVNGSFLTGNNIYDKGLSFGENSIGEIFNIDFHLKLDWHY